jgi:hypothetical protein
MSLYHETQQSVGHVLNLVAGVATLAVAILFIALLVIELIRRPRYSVTTLLIVTTTLAILLGIGAFSRR